MQKLLFCFLVFALVGCKEKYIPKVNQTATNFLVVDGTINSGSGPTVIRLSRTTKMTDTVRFNPETGATVSVQGNDNTNFALVDNGKGIYSANQLTLNNARQYRVHIKTKDGKEYASDYVEVKITPAIDSVSWVRRADGVHIYANSHDAQNKTKYYRWDYEETWEERSTVIAKYEYQPANNKVIEIDPNAVNLFYCWKTRFSTSLLLGTSAALATDIVTQQPMLEISNASEKLGVRYSILVRQYALTKEGYDFYTLMKKNTEQLGDIFGPLPTEITGNVHSLSDVNEKVIGFISASTVTEKRIFITESQVPGWDYLLNCETKIVDNKDDSLKEYFTFMYRPYDAIVNSNNQIVAYWGITPRCADCRLRGGINVKPSFW
jgi:hypothetical protein